MLIVCQEPEAAITDPFVRLEAVLSDAIDFATAPGAPPALSAALRHAVFPGGARIRPRLCLAVAEACGNPHPRLSAGVAAAIELIHCASLVHDDLPCFDNSPLRRGCASVQARFGAPAAILAGDALIVLGFGTLAQHCADAPALLAPLVSILAACSGMPNGIAGGQGWECEPHIDPVSYARAKTGALFAAASMAGAVAAGAEAEPWRLFGERLGCAYQVADDLADALSDASTLGKPAGRDAELGRPNAALLLGANGARARLDALMAESVAAVPACPDRERLAALVSAEVRRLMPPGLLCAA